MSRKAAVGALDRFFAIYWASIDALESDGVDAVRCEWLGAAYACALLPTLTQHVDARAWRLGARIVRLVAEGPPLEERDAALWLGDNSNGNRQFQVKASAAAAEEAAVPVVRAPPAEPLLQHHLGWGVVA